MNGDASREMLIARSIAIETYANLEQSMCLLFAHLSGTSNAVAGTIFFRLTNSASRLAILDKLMRMKHGSEHRTFFNSFISRMKPFDGRRNQVVHWHTSHTIRDIADGGLEAVPRLGPPNFWVRDDETPELSAADVRAFADEADFYSITIMTFTMMMLAKTMPMYEPWRGIFAEPIAYPPQGDHPAARPVGTQPSQRQPSRP